LESWYQIRSDRPESKIGSINSSSHNGTIVAGSIGRVNVIASQRFLNEGSLVASIAATNGGIGSISAANSIISIDNIVSRGSLGSITAGGELGGTIFAGLLPGTNIGSIKASKITSANIVTRQLGSLTTVANPARNLAGNIESSSIYAFGNNANVGLGTVNIKGKIENSVFNIADGDVTSFTAGAMWNSRLQVGGRFTLGNTVDNAMIFDAPTRKIGILNLTNPFSGASSPIQDPLDSAAFRDSYIGAANLGTINIAGAASDSSLATETQGIAFRNGGSAGTVKVAGTTVANNSTIAASRFRKAGN
jgi:hypothetical protein